MKEGAASLKGAARSVSLTPCAHRGLYTCSLRPMPELFKAKCSQVMFPLLNALQQELKEGKYVTLFFASVCSNTLML